MRLDESMLLHADTMSEKMKKNVTEHVGRAIALLVIIVCAIFTFAEVAFVDISLEKFTFEGVVVLSLALIMYLSLQSEGEGYAKRQKGYEEAKGYADDLADKVKGEDLKHLQAYLLEVYQGEMRSKEDRLLLASGLTREELERYRSGERFGKKRSRQLRRVAKVHNRAILPNELLFFEGEGKDDINTTPKRTRFLGILRIIPSILCTLLTVAVMIDLKEGISLRLVLEGILKLSALISMGLRGYLSGIHYVNETLIPYHKLRGKLLDSFLRRRKEAGE